MADLADPFIIVFDTDCVLCSGWVHFILKYEARPLARFVSAWSEQGLTLAAAHGLSAGDLDRTFLVVRDGQPLVRSDAALAIISELKASLRWLAFLRVFPRFLRDGAYNLVARNRYRWFGRKDQCFIAPEDQKHRFVNGPPRPDHPALSP